MDGKRVLNLQYFFSQWLCILSFSFQINSYFEKIHLLKKSKVWYLQWKEEQHSNYWRAMLLSQNQDIKISDLKSKLLGRRYHSPPAVAPSAKKLCWDRPTPVKCSLCWVFQSQTQFLSRSKPWLKNLTYTAVSYLAKI